MNPTERRRAMTIGSCLIAVVAGVTLAAPQAIAATATDTTPPSVPQNLHTAGRSASDTVVSWDASTDNSGSVYHYWVLVDGGQRARPTATTYDVQTLVYLCRISPGTHSITVQAVDRALNRSAPSSPILVTAS